MKTDSVYRYLTISRFRTIFRCLKWTMRTLLTIGVCATITGGIAFSMTTNEVYFGVMIAGVLISISSILGVLVMKFALRDLQTNNKGK